MIAISEKSIQTVLEMHLKNKILTCPEHPKMCFILLNFTLLIVIKNYRQYAFKIQVKIGRYINQKTKDLMI